MTNLESLIQDFLEQQGIDITTVVSYHFPDNLPNKNIEDVSIDMEKLLTEFYLFINMQKHKHLKKDAI